MANGRWQIGLHIQKDSVRAVALSRKRGGWALCRWWHMPASDRLWPDGAAIAGEPLTQALRQWRAQLPRGHSLRVAFPAQRTRQRDIPRPAGLLCESECESWLAGAAARELHLPTESLWLDYTLGEAPARFQVTAAQRRETEALLASFQAAGLQPETLTPDACALAAFWPSAPDNVQLIACKGADAWLWASRSRWGVSEHGELLAQAREMNISAQQIAICGALPEDASNCLQLDPLCFVTFQPPPLLKEAACYTVALGLAMGEVAR
ncbi:hypothetical protein [Franconibacter helveticus]|uniref:hypothetical protein n=1 Tax=Franconibacter helveticus TaxID=357240 RepID=UPI00066B523B|nr:hypothetical protein [Franconibacter helveticus]